jgi:hypothetical protein
MNVTRLTAVGVALALLVALAWGFVDAGRDPSANLRITSDGAPPFGDAHWQPEVDAPTPLKAEVVSDGILYKMRIRREVRSVDERAFEVRTFVDWGAAWELLPQERRVRRVSQERIAEAERAFTGAVVDERITGDGEVVRRAMTLGGATDTPKIFRGLLDDTFEAMAMLSPRMPQQPVGIGATWVERRDVGVGVGDLLTVPAALHVRRASEPVLHNPRVPVVMDVQIGGPLGEPGGRLLERETPRESGARAYLNVADVRGSGTARVYPVRGIATGQVRYQLLGVLTVVDAAGIGRTPVNVTVRAEVERAD